MRYWVSLRSLLSEGNAGVQHDLCTNVLVSPSMILLVTCYHVAIRLDLCSIPALCGSPWLRNVGWALGLGTETLIDRQSLFVGKDLTRPGPSVRLVRPTNDTSDSVARGLLEKFWAC